MFLSNKINASFFQYLESKYQETNRIVKDTNGINYLMMIAIDSNYDTAFLNLDNYDIASEFTYNGSIYDVQLKLTDKSIANVPAGSLFVINRQNKPTQKKIISIDKKFKTY